MIYFDVVVGILRFAEEILKAFVIGIVAGLKSCFEMRFLHFMV